MLQAQRGSHARQTPLVVRGTQGNSHRLPLFPRVYFRHGFFLAGIESRNISFLHIEAVQPPGSSGRPRCQRFPLHTVFSIRVRFPQIEIPDTLTPCIGHDRHTMITIHPARISRNLRKIRKAVTSVRLCHSQKRTNHIRMLRGIKQNTQRMCRTVTVPNPVVRIICVPAIIMHLVVIDAETHDGRSPYLQRSESFPTLHSIYDDLLRPPSPTQIPVFPSSGSSWPAPH